MNFAEGRDDKIAELNRILSRGGAVLFTGAGFSVPSGIPDFRSQGGIYDTSAGGRSAEYMLSHECLVEHPDEFFEFYKTKMIYPNAKPNAAHVKFAELEKAGFVDAVVTQNIDGLHQAAGLVDLFEGENLVLINKTPTPKDGLATLAIYGDVAEVAKRIEVSK